MSKSTLQGALSDVAGDNRAGLRDQCYEGAWVLPRQDPPYTRDSINFSIHDKQRLQEKLSVAPSRTKFFQLLKRNNFH